MQFSKINFNFLNKSSILSIKLLFTTFTIIFLTNITGYVDAKIPEYKGLYTLFSPEFTTDTIGIGQSLRYSNWLENVYTYAPKDNAARKVIATLWFKRLINDEGEFDENDNFGPSTKHPASSVLKAKDFGKLIKYIREFTKKDNAGKEKSAELLNKERDAIKLTNNGKGDRIKLTEFIKSLEELKFNDKFIPEMAECILWAFFDRKENCGEKEFKECLDEINKDYWIKLQDKKIQDSSYAIDETTDKATIENIVKKLIQKPNDKDNSVHYDALTRYMIKSEKTKTVPNKVFQTKLNYKDPKTGNSTKEPFPTCFESAILDVISILIYNRDQMLYDQNILSTTTTDSEAFKNLIDKVFKKLPEGKKDANKILILSENINENKQIQCWIDLVTNLDILTYKDNVDNISYDLEPSIENFIKVLNRFLNLGFVITDMVETLEIEFKNKDKISIEKNKIEYWQILFNIISQRLSTVNREVKFSIKEMPTVTKDATKSMSLGAIDITIGKTELKMIIDNDHAHVDCTERDKSQLAAKNLQDLKKILTYKLAQDMDKNKNLIPLFIFLSYIDVIYESPTNKIKALNKKEVEELLYYSFELKDSNTKLDLLDKIFESKIPVIKQIYSNKSIRESISKLIDILSKDEDFEHSLFSFLIVCDDKDKESCWQSEIEAKITETIDPKIDEAIEQEDKTELLSIFSNINHEAKIINKFLKKILNKILKDPNIKNKDNMTPLMIACGCGGNLEIAKMLLTNPKTDVNAKDVNGNTAMSLAASCNCGDDEEIAEILIKNPKVDLAFKQEKLYALALDPDKAELFKILLDNPKININEKDQYGDTALMIAVRNTKPEIVKILLNNLKININEKDENGYTALMLAIYNKNLEIEIVEMLVNNPKININEKDQYGYTALMIAVCNNKPEIVKILLNNLKIDINEKDQYGNTALMIAIYNEKLEIEIVKMLVDNPKININEKDQYGDTALMIAVCNNKPEIVKILLNNLKIDINISKLGITPKKQAEYKNLDEIVKLFEKYEQKKL